eukprot:COSAG06_NODE_8301_length_2208_cov_87.710289_3_plen_169_part_00
MAIVLVASAPRGRARHSVPRSSGQENRAPDLAVLSRALWQLLTLEVATKRAFLAKSDTGRRAVSKYDAWAMHRPEDDTRPVCSTKYDTKYRIHYKYDTTRPHCRKYDTQKRPGFVPRYQLEGKSPATEGALGSTRRDGDCDGPISYAKQEAKGTGMEVPRYTWTRYRF